MTVPGVRRVALAVATALAIATVVLAARSSAWAAEPDQPIDGAAVSALLDRIEAQEQGLEQGGDLLASMLGEGAPTPNPWSHYDLGASVGPVEEVNTLIARMLFALGRWAVATCHLVVGWALRFDLGRVLAGPAADLAATYQARLIGPLRLTQLALLLAVARTSWLLLRQRTSSGLAELGVALLIAAAGAAVVADAGRAACAGLDLLGGTTRAVVALSLDEGAAPAATDVCAEQGAVEQPLGFEAAVFETFVVEPHLLLQWGALPRPGSTCRRIADGLVARGAWGDADFPRTVMEEAGCRSLTRFNASMGADRVMGATAYAMAAVAFTVAVLATVGALLAGQVGGAVLVLALPFALVAGVAPGAGRQLLGRWVHAVLRVAVLFIGSAFLLVVLVTGVAAVDDGMAGQPVGLRMGASAAIAWVLVLLRRQAFSGLRAAARSGASRAAGRSTDVWWTAQGPAAVIPDGVQHHGGRERRATSTVQVTGYARGATSLPAGRRHHGGTM